MTRARTPRPAEIQAAAQDPRLLRARTAKPDLGWRAEGRCRTVDPKEFFQIACESDMALALCRGCDVQSACLAFALNSGDCEGVYGATTARERRAMLVAWHTPQPAGIMP